MALVVEKGLKVKNIFNYVAIIVWYTTKICVLYILKYSSTTMVCAKPLVAIS